MSDTPETDAMVEESFHRINFPTAPVPAEFARKLERERDEALMDRANGDIATMTINHYERILQERDEWAAMCGRYKQERDEIKEKYRFAVIHWQIGSAKMERERDEAREKLENEMKWHHRTHQELIEAQCKLLDIEYDKLKS